MKKVNRLRISAGCETMESRVMLCGSSLHGACQASSMAETSMAESCQPASGITSTTNASQVNDTVNINNINTMSGGSGSFLRRRGFGGFRGQSSYGMSMQNNGTSMVSNGSNAGSSSGSGTNSSNSWGGGITINNVNNLNGGFQQNGVGSGGECAPTPTPTPTPSGPPAIGSTRSFNGNDYTLQKMSNGKLTYKNESLRGGQRTVDVRADGEIKTHSPIALDLNGSGSIETTGSSTAKIRAAGTALGQTVKFDLTGDGKTERIEWMAGNGDGLLVDNRDGNAAGSMNGTRLFGDQNGQFDSGYDKLARLDANRDGQLAGTELSGLEVWIDNGDASVQSGELKSLADVGVTEISVNQIYVSNASGETLMQSTAQQNGVSVLTEDVWFGQA